MSEERERQRESFFAAKMSIDYDCVTRHISVVFSHPSKAVRKIFNNVISDNCNFFSIRSTW